MNDKVALAFDQYRHRDGLEFAIVFKRLELIELEDSSNSAVLMPLLELREVEIPRDSRHATESAFYRLSVDTK